jgi:hypothetical protein
VLECSCYITKSNLFHGIMNLYSYNLIECVYVEQSRCSHTNELFTDSELSKHPICIFKIYSCHYIVLPIAVSSFERNPLISSSEKT